MLKKPSGLAFRLYPLILLTLFFAGCAHGPGVRVGAVPPSLSVYRTAINSAFYLPLPAVAGELRAEQRWDPETHVWSVTAGPHLLRVSPRIPLAVVDGVAQLLPYSPVVKAGELFIPEFLWKRWLFSWGSSAVTVSAPQRRKLKTIVLDPGHGGKDSGAVGKGGLKEKRVTLDIALRLRDVLEQDGYKVVMTRNDDRFISLPRRAQIANEADADMFVSIHANASRQRSSSGFEVFYLSDATDDHARALEAAENDSLPLETEEAVSSDTEVIVWDLLNTAFRAESRELAGSVCRGLKAVRVPSEDRGVKSARFAVLKGSRMPAILVEVGFVTNPSESGWLNLPDYRQRLADGIKQGIGGYAANVDQHG